MKTDELVRALAADAAAPAATAARVWLAAAGAAVATAGLVFAATLRPRPDLWQALATPRFDFKYLVALALLAVAAPLASQLWRPAGQVRPALIALVPLVVAAGAAAEFFVLAPDARLAALVGQNAVACLLAVPGIGLGPLAAFILALRRGAPTRPELAGAVAGLAAAGVSIAFYALHCPDDSPLFLATWYTIATLVLAGLGALAGRRFLRW